MFQAKQRLNQSPKKEKLSLTRQSKREKTRLKLNVNSFGVLDVEIPRPDNPREISEIFEAIKPQVRRKSHPPTKHTKLHQRSVAIVDRLDDQLVLPVKWKGKRPFPVKGFVEEPHRFSKSIFGNCYCQVGIYAERGAMKIEMVPDPLPALNKLGRWFGRIGQTKKFRRVLRVLVVCGFSPADFVSLMRIRDLYIRRKFAAYEKGITGFLSTLPKAAVALSKTLGSRKVKTKR